MIISKSDIIEYIRSHYRGFEKYHYGNELIIEEKDFIIVNDIYKVDESRLNMDKDIFISGILPERQTNSGNIRLLCEALNADGSGLGDDVYQALEEYNRHYTRAFLKNGAHWVTLEAFFKALEKIKKSIGNYNPRSFVQISKYSGLSANILDSSNVKLNLFDLRTLYELVCIENRKLNYDILIQPVTTFSDKTNLGMEYETLYQSKYFKNFELHKDIKVDHEYHVNGVLTGLSARKKRPFASAKVHYYCFDLFKLLNMDYSYLKLKTSKTDAFDGVVLLNQKPLAHQVMLKKIKVSCSFSFYTSIATRLLTGLSNSSPKFREIYDYTRPVELSSLSSGERRDLLASGEGMLVYRVDRTVYEDENNPEDSYKKSGIVVEEGEYFGAKYSLTSIKYSTQPTIKNIMDYGFSHSKNSASSEMIASWKSRDRQLQMVKLYETALQERENAVNKARQLEEAKKELELLNTSLEIKVQERTVELEKYNKHLEEVVHEKVVEITELQLATIFALAKLAESRDDETGKHLERVQTLCKILAYLLKDHSRYQDSITEAFIQSVIYASPLHDVGKVGIPDKILLKPGKLLPEEFEIMKTHASIGAKTLEAVKGRYSRNSYIETGIDIAHYHHENWDGTGYPEKLSGEAIPLSARIMKLTDVYDALRSKRVYKPAFQHEEAMKIIIEGNSTQFDPEIVKVFVSNEKLLEQAYDDMME